MRSLKKKQRYVTDKVACIILAGGKGTRLHPLTEHRSKPAVTFGGHYRLIDIPISNALNAQLRNIYVISQYFSTSLNTHIKEAYPLDQYQGTRMMMLTPEENPEGKVWFEGTADAVRKTIHYYLNTPIDYFVILSGDQLYNMDISAMLSFAKEKDADLTIATLPVAQALAPRMGIMKINEQQDIIDFVEKPSDEKQLKEFALSERFTKKHRVQLDTQPSYLASMGIYVFKKEVLVSLLQEDTRDDFGKHLIPTQMKKGKTAAFLYQGYWEDIGTVRSFYDANLSLTRNNLNLDLYDETAPIYSHVPPLPCARVVGSNVVDSILCNGSISYGREITNSIVGVRTTIDEGSVIRDTIIQGNQYYRCHSKEGESFAYGIGKNCRIEKAVIDENVRIGNNVQLINRQNLTHYDGHGIYIRDGIIVVPSNTKIPDGFTL